MWGCISVQGNCRKLGEVMDVTWIVVTVSPACVQVPAHRTRAVLGYQDSSGQPLNRHVTHRKHFTTMKDKYGLTECCCPQQPEQPGHLSQGRHPPVRRDVDVVSATQPRSPGGRTTLGWLLGLHLPLKGLGRRVACCEVARPRWLRLSALRVSAAEEQGDSFVLVFVTERQPLQKALCLHGRLEIHSFAGIIIVIVTVH